MISVVDLLANVNAGEVWLNDNGSSDLTAREYFGVSDPIADVTAECADAERAGLIVRPPPPSRRAAARRPFHRDLHAHWTGSMITDCCGAATSLRTDPPLQQHAPECRDAR